MPSTFNCPYGCKCKVDCVMREEKDNAQKRYYWKNRGKVLTKARKRWAECKSKIAARRQLRYYIKRGGKSKRANDEMLAVGRRIKEKDRRASPEYKVWAKGRQDTGRKNLDRWYLLSVLRRKGIVSPSESQIAECKRSLKIKRVRRARVRLPESERKRLAAMVKEMRRRKNK